jgi:hypothetical protein
MVPCSRSEDRPVSTRTKRSIVRFSAPFALPGIDEMQPPGDYAVDSDEEPIEGISWLAYRRVATFIHLPAIESSSRIGRMVAVEPAALDTALQRDGGQLS